MSEGGPSRMPSPVARPDWWDAFLAWVDDLPAKRPPADLASYIVESAPRDWKQSGLLDPVVWSMRYILDISNKRVPLRGIELIENRWLPFHDELLHRGPPEFRARLCDARWVLRNGHREHAIAAIRAYLEAAKSRADDDRWPNPGHYARRALGLAKQLNCEDLHHEARQVALDLMRSDNVAWTIRVTIAEGFAREPTDVAREVALLVEGYVDGAASAKERQSWGVRRTAARIAADAWTTAGDFEKAARLKHLRAQLWVEEGIAYGASEHAMHLAIDILAKGVRALQELGHRAEAEIAHRRMLELQRLSESRFQDVSGPSVDLTSAAMETIAALRGRPFGEQLIALCRRVPRPSIARLRDLAAASVEQFKFHSLVTIQHVDDQGRGLKTPSDPIVRSMLQHWRDERGCIVVGIIEPARQQIASETHGGVREWIEWLQDRPLADSDHALALASGLAAGLAGEWIVSSSILVPQLEYLVRRLLVEANELTSILNADGTQRETLFSELLRKPKLTEILGDDWVFDLTSLLVEPGSNLRNKVAHGMVPDRHFYAVESVYLWFLVIDLLISVTLRDNSRNGIR